MRLPLLSLSVFALIAFFSLPAAAQEADGGSIVSCGEPAPPELNTNPPNEFCDIYTRQLAYRPERLKLQQMLAERQKNFVIPRDQAYKNYRANLEALNGERGASSGGR